MTSGEGMPVTLEADQTAPFLPISPLGSALHCSHSRSSPLLPPGKSHVEALGLPPCLPPSEAWLDNSQKQAGPGAWLSPPGAVWLSHTLTMPLPDPPHPTPSLLSRPDSTLLADERVQH